MTIDSNSSDSEDPTYDVIVVGFGGAGACAAIAAADAEASVLVLDRGYGGGSTYHSGGVVYAGGGTKIQHEAEVSDTPDDMFAYLQRETAGVVTDETLRRFVDGSAEMIEWLEGQGLEFEGSVCPYKTSYPTNRHYLYYSGNELATGYSDVATPAPRGHRTRARNFSGATYYGKLRDSALEKGVTFRALAQVTRLIVEDDAVVGVDFLAPATTDMPSERFRKFSTFAEKMGIWYAPIGDRLNRIVERDRLRRSTSRRARARGGVILSTGGYGFDETLIARHAPAWMDVPPLGTMGDDGAALELASPLQASTGRMESISGWRFIAPPSAFMEGIVVNGHGARIANEQLYGATQTKPLIEENGGTGFLVVGADTWRRARSQLRSQTAFFHAPQMAYLFSPIGHRKAGTLRALAGKIGVDPAGLEFTVSAYNAAIDNGRSDQFGKKDEFQHPLTTGPFYAINLSPNVSPAYPLAFITLGGLVVDEHTGQVISTDSRSIRGLYAAGRSAVGICSNSYVSGLALADGVFSGRRAGEHAAAQAPTTALDGSQEAI